LTISDQNSASKVPIFPPAVRFYCGSKLALYRYSLEDGQSIVFMDSCQVDDIHAINGGELWAVIGLETFFGDCDYLLHWDVESATDSFE